MMKRKATIFILTALLGLQLSACGKGKKESRALIESGRRSMAEGYLGDAIDAFEKAWELDKKNKVILYELAEIYLDARDLPAARRTVDKIFSVNEGDLAGKIILARVERMSGNPARALEVLQEVEAYDKTIAEVYLEQGLSYIAMGKTRQAVEVLVTASGLAEKDPATLLEIGAALMDIPAYELAIQVYNKVNELEPENARAYMGMGVCFQNMEETYAALGALTRAAYLDPDDAEILIRRGITELAMGMFQPALETFKKAHEMDTRALLPQYYKAVTYYEMGETAKGITMLRTITRVYKDFIPGLETLGEFYAREKKLPEAINHFRMALGVDGSYHAARLKLAQAYYENGNKDLAIEELKYLVHKNPTDEVRKEAQLLLELYR